MPARTDPPDARRQLSEAELNFPACLYPQAAGHVRGSNCPPRAL
jgi:hypothetical protein